MRVIWGGPAFGSEGKILDSYEDSISGDFYRSCFPDNSFLGLLLLLINWRWTHLCNILYPSHFWYPPVYLIFIFDCFPCGEGTNSKCLLLCGRSVALSLPVSPWRCSHIGMSVSQGEMWETSYGSSWGSQLNTLAHINIWLWQIRSQHFYLLCPQKQELRYWVLMF